MDTTRSTPKARKRHWCEVCGWAIEPGETYERAVTFDGGDVLTWKAHITPCQVGSMLAFNANYGDGEVIRGWDIAEWASDIARHEPLSSPEAVEIHRRLEINTERARERAGKESDR